MNIVKKAIDQFGLYCLIGLSAVVNIYDIWRLGVGNTYYAAGIKSMLTSFSNFFFLSFDSTGFISIDKAPLSLWVDALFAKILGFSGIAILLPHALEGVLVTFLVYKIVEKAMGKVPAFVAGLTIALSPVNVAVYRNNTPDALLLVFVLLTIWFFQKYIFSKQFKFLLISATMLGLGFNTKMLQAYLILPAVSMAIFLFSPGTFFQRLRSTTVFILVTVFVSALWITAVDLTPVSLRPYVGGSENNSAWNLALAYNGTERLLGESSVGGNAGFNVGEKGLLRLFTGEMGTQAGWFLASTILFSFYFIWKNFKKLFLRVLNKDIAFSTAEVITILSIGYLLTAYVFFSFASFFHSYYLNILGVPVAFLMGGLIYELKESSHKRLGFFALSVSALVQMSLVAQAQYAGWLIPVILVAGVMALIIFINSKTSQAMIISISILLSTLFITPAVWSGYTTLYGNTATAIFIGGPSVGNSFGGVPTQTDGIGRGVFGGQSVSTELLAYLKEHYTGEKYFVAVASQQQATGFILDNNITNIMTLGGFSGRDKAITLTELKAKIQKGEIKYFLLNQGFGGFGGDGNLGVNRQGGGMFNANSDITTWVQNNCTAVTGFSGLYSCSAS